QPLYFGAGSPSSVRLTVQELDPVGNIINTGSGPVDNWGGLTMNVSETSFTGFFSFDVPFIGSAPATTAGSTVNLQYSGGTPVPITNTAVTVTVTDWNS